MKAIKFEISELYSVELPRGMYRIDNKIINISSNEKVQVKDINNVIPIPKKSIIQHYIYNGEEIISNEVYESIKYKLSLPRNEDGIWNSLEDEFAYRKFNQLHVPIYKDIFIDNDPLLFEIIESQIDTGNKFILSEYANGGQDPLLYIYHRSSAVREIVNNKFNELGMIFSGTINHSDSKGKKIWGNSTHSVVRFVVAFGKYIFSDAWEIKHPLRGTLEMMIAKYNSDKNELERIIQQNYNEHFGIFDDKKFQASDVLSTLKGVRSKLQQTDFMKKGYDNYYFIRKNLNEAILQIESAFIVE